MQATSFLGRASPPVLIAFERADIPMPTVLVDAPPLLEMVEAQPPRLRGLRSALPRAWWKPAVRLRRAARSLRP